MVYCGWLSNLNLVFNEKVDMSCSLEDEMLTLKGKKCYVDQAAKTIAEKVWQTFDER